MNTSYRFQSSSKRTFAVTFLCALMVFAPVQRTHALFGIGDIVFDPANLFEAVLQGFNIVEQVAQLQEGVQKATQAVALAQEVKRVLSNPETALSYAGYLIGNSDALDEFLGEAAVSDMKASIRAIESLGDDIDRLGRRINEFDDIEGYELKGDFFQRYAQLSAMHNRLERRLDTVAKQGGGREDEWRMREMRRIRSQAATANTEHTRERLRDQREDLSVEDQLVHNQRHRDYMDYHSTILNMEIEEEFSEAMDRDASAQIADANMEKQVEANVTLDQKMQAWMRGKHAAEMGVGE